MLRLQRAFAGLAIFALAACGGDGTGPPPAPTVTGVTVSPATASIRIGETQPLTSVVQGSAGVSTAVTWISETPSVATVSGQGVVTAVAPGNALIRATSVADSKFSGTAQIQVLARSVAVAPATVSM